MINNNKIHTKNIIVQISHHSTTFKLNNVELKEISGEYEEVPAILSMNNTIYKYTIEEIYFLLTTNTKRILTTIHYLKFWAKFPGIKCLIVFEQNDFMNNRNITEYLLKEGILCKVLPSNVGRYEERYLELFHLAWNNQEINNTYNEKKDIKWFAVGDDDTVWFRNNLLHILRQYNSSNSIYLGDISDKKYQIEIFGDYFAYGGGGVLLSRPLTLLFSQHFQECKRFTNIYGGDGMIGKCITEVIKVNLTKNNHFHQMDHHGDMTGYMESGLDGLASLHHMFASWRPFPDDHTNQVNETVYLLQLAYTTFNEKFLKRYVRMNHKTNQTLLLTMGYTFSLFNRILSQEDLSQIEKTWKGSEMVGRKTRPEENDKITWFFRRVIPRNFNGLISYEAVYETRKNVGDPILKIEVTFNN
jgi:hypothetical protein